MNIFKYLPGLCISTLVFAQELPPLKVGVESFAPPFVIVGKGNHIYGFDADMMQTLCNTIKRKCVFQTMPFSEIINAVATGKVDMGLSAIAITAERAQIVNFSLPYLIIYHRFLTRKDNATETFHFSALNNKPIGYEAGTILDKIIGGLPITQPQLTTYKHIEDEVLALYDGNVDFIILDNPTALYWQANSSDRLVTFGPPLPSSLSLGIAINPQDQTLLYSINQALEIYLKNGGFNANYDKYLTQFDPAAA